MKNKQSTIIIILIIITGLSLLLYPTVSNYLKTIAYGNAITDYRRVVEELEPENYEDILAQARAYNEGLVSREYILSDFTEEDEREYQSQIQIPGTSVMGYVVIPKIDISLPIYHGTGEVALQNGAGHLEGSSLPIGGKGTHAVLSAHRGLPSAKLFTDIDRLVLGDTFQIYVLGEVLTYEVDDLQTVLPNDTSVLRIDPEEDYCTLLTCTPYGVNSHRLLVRGYRIPTPEEESIAEVPLEDGKIGGIRAEIVLLVASVLGVVLISVLVILLRRWLDRRTYRGKYARKGFKH